MKRLVCAAVAAASLVSGVAQAGPWDGRDREVVYLAKTKISGLGDSDVLQINSCIGPERERIAAIKLVISRSAVRIDDLVVTYGPDRMNPRRDRDRLPVREYLSPGATHWIDLEGRARCVETIQIVGQGQSILQQARIEIYGLKRGDNWGHDRWGRDDRRDDRWGRDDRRDDWGRDRRDDRRQPPPPPPRDDRRDDWGRDRRDDRRDDRHTPPPPPRDDRRDDRRDDWGNRGDRGPRTPVKSAAQCYLEDNPDICQNSPDNFCKDPSAHYNKYGRNEGRTWGCKQ